MICSASSYPEKLNKDNSYSNISQRYCWSKLPAGDWSPGWVGAEDMFEQDPSRQVLRGIHLENQLLAAVSSQTVKQLNRVYLRLFI